MANVVLPTVIQGPAFISVGGQVIYVQKDITVNDEVESWNPDSSFGPIGERHKSRKDVISFTPVGMVNWALGGLLNYFYAAFLDPSKIGTSIFAAPGTVVITSLAENKTYNWARGGMSKPPGLVLKPTATAFGAMEVTCLGASGIQPTTATWWKAADGVPVADTHFDQSLIVSDIYTAKLGTRATPFDALGGMDGFEVGFDMQLAPVPAADVGIADIILAGLGMTVNFAPSNLTEAQVDTLLALQGPGAVLPGQTYAKAGDDLTITGQGGQGVIVRRVGAKKSSRVYAVGQHRFKTLDFVNERTWTNGAPGPLLSLIAPS